MVSNGQLLPQDAFTRIQELASQDLGFAVVDHHRSLRKGFPEVVFGEGKTPEQCATIAATIFERTGAVIVTRAQSKHYAAIRKVMPKAIYNQVAKTIYVAPNIAPAERYGPVVIVCAGTADIPVAEEAAITSEVMGCSVQRIWDVGVAGLHRLMARIDVLCNATVIVAVAGMDGALPGVVAGLVRAPVIGVPTSIGYGVSFNGLAALMTMLNSCAPGLSVVNIDGGHLAGYQAAIIASQNKITKGIDRPSQ